MMSSRAVLTLTNVDLDLPVFGASPRLFKLSKLASVTGGKLIINSNLTYVKALNSISCTINQGEKIGLIGHNGAGKSSFLRLISGIYAPSSGSLVRLCKVTPMLQRSFLTSPDLSGIHAVKAHYLTSHLSLDGFDEHLYDIISFSGLAPYIHLPIKSYSDGMRARLMFALLTSVPNECLAIDEGFGSGDLPFFKHARRRMNNFLHSAGTLLFASHSEELMNKFCQRGLVFSQGSIVYDGLLLDALKYYHEQVS